MYIRKVFQNNIIQVYLFSKNVTFHILPLKNVLIFLFSQKTILHNFIRFLDKWKNCKTFAHFRNEEPTKRLMKCTPSFRWRNCLYGEGHAKGVEPWTNEIYEVLRLWLVRFSNIDSGDSDWIKSSRAHLSRFFETRGRICCK